MIQNDYFIKDHRFS